MTTQLSTLGRTTLLVRAYEPALGFYRDKLGFVVLRDVVAADGTRELQLALPAQAGEPAVGLDLREAVGVDAALVGCQAGTHPFLTLFTADCHHSVKALAARGVTVRQEPREIDGAIVAHVADLYGNELLVCQQASPERSS
jgi:Glyoxalase/Bleomycin resistance protein/Dioxygenase superfamily.